MVLVLALESASASTNQGQSTVHGRRFLGSSACTSARTGAEGRRHQIQSCGVGRGWRPVGTLFLSSSSSGVYSRTNTVCAERWEARTFQQVVQELPTALTNRGRFRRSDEHEDFLSGEELASAPDDSVMSVLLHTSFPVKSLPFCWVLICFENLAW